MLIRQLPLDLRAPQRRLARVRRTRPGPGQRAAGRCRAAWWCWARTADHHLYGWDNEYGRLETRVAPFRAARFLVSNGEFKTFVDAGGYGQQRWWTEEGWGWRIYQEADASPLLGAGRRPVAPALHGAGDPHALELAGRGQPARGQGLLQLEGRSRPAARCACRPRRNGTACSSTAASATCRDLGRGARATSTWPARPPACPVDEHLHGGFGDLVGNVWQHTETPISGFPGFAVHPLYDDFSTPTFDTEHNLIKGGSWISTGNEATRDSRYAFRRHFYQHAGFRYIESAQAVVGRERRLRDRRPGQPVLRVPLRRPSTSACPTSRCAAPSSAPRPPAAGASAAPWTWAAPPAAPPSSWPASATTSPASTSRPASSRWATSCRRRARSATSCPRRASWSPTTSAPWPDLGLDGLRDKVEFWQGDAHNLKPQFTGLRPGAGGQPHRPALRSARASWS